MSTMNYIVKENEQLLNIAVEQNINYIELLRLNPSLQSFPFSIKAGESLVIPSTDLQPQPPLEENVEQVIQKTATNNEGCISAPIFTACDILMFTGDKPENYFILDKRAQQEVLKEASFLDALSKEYLEIAKQVISDEDDSHSSFLAKNTWLRKAARAGLFEVDGLPVNELSTIETLNVEVIKDKLTSIEQKQIILSDYYQRCQEEGYLYINQFDSFQPVWNNLFDSLNQNINLLNQLLEQDALKNTEVNVSIADVLEQTQKRADTPIDVNEFGIIEALLISQNHRIYLRPDFVNGHQKQWKNNSSAKDFKESFLDQESLSTVLFDDIKNTKFVANNPKEIEMLSMSWDTNNIGGFKFNEWLFTGHLNSNIASAPFAVSAEAQLLRFCSHDKNISFDSSNNEVDLFVSHKAQVSLIDGNVTIEKYFPYESGMPVSFVYRNANGVDVFYPFGYFRSNLCVELCCFGEEQYEQGNRSGIRSIISANIEVGISSLKAGSVGIKANALTKDNSGGLLLGSIEWRFPKDDVVNGFTPLLTLKKEGNVTLEDDFPGPFQLVLNKNHLIFYSKGEFLLGNGGSGGIGTIVEPEVHWSFAILLWSLLQTVGYRHVYCINEAAYHYFSQCAYYLFVNDVADLKSVINLEVNVLGSWWDERNNNINRLPIKAQEAQSIANKILSGKDIFSGKHINLLPPETIGMLLDTLISTFTFNLARSQEIAVQYLLRRTVGKSWRKLEEILAHMSAAGNKIANEDGLFRSIARIHNILDNKQKIEFNDWVRWVAEGEDEFNVESSPFTLSIDQKTFESKFSTLNITVD